MPVYKFTCSCGCNGILTTNFDVEYVQCPYCHKDLQNIKPND